MIAARPLLLTTFLCAALILLAGCPRNSAGNLPGDWQYVAVDASSSDAAEFRATLHFGEPGSGGLGAFRYEEQLLLPDDDEGNVSWHPSYYAEGFYRTAPYGHGAGADTATYWADTKLNVLVSEYAPELVVSVDADTGDYVYELSPTTLDGDTPTNSRAVLSITPFDELVIAWGAHVPGAAGAPPDTKTFAINTGINADTYVRMTD